MPSTSSLKLAEDDGIQKLVQEKQEFRKKDVKHSSGRRTKRDSSGKRSVLKCVETTKRRLVEESSSESEILYLDSSDLEFCDENIEDTSDFENNQKERFIFVNVHEQLYGSSGKK